MGDAFGELVHTPWTLPMPPPARRFPGLLALGPGTGLMDMIDPRNNVPAQ
ncbi:hypothetical protein [Dactylosporangium sp. CA-139066]